jgi:hypothetical protein
VGLRLSFGLETKIAAFAAMTGETRRAVVAFPPAAD